MKRQIVNIVNFIRGNEPREHIDLLTPVLEQIKLLKKHNLKGTFLLQYDALIDPAYTQPLKNVLSDNIEAGIWLEIVQPLVEKAGLKWRGRTVWDWHAHCGFLVGYTPDERKKLVDVVMEDFKTIFGFYPRSLGCWAFDAYTLEYLSSTYGIDAACNCKEQWGTDGYTLWGGYYNQGYYPSKNNILCPAQTREEQIDTPIFRMLGSDPIYQYDCGLNLKDGAADLQGVITLEPVYIGATGGGGIPQWVDWYFMENFNGDCINFGYTQVGQENSFGWPAMKKGLTYQIEQIAKLRAENKLEVETLGETGRWFKSAFAQTPATAVTAHTDWRNEGRKSVWYNCKNYRVNIFAERGRFWIRDLYLFDEKYRERYFETVCDSDSLQFDNLPVMDGNRWSGHGVRAGIYPMLGQEEITFNELRYSEDGENAILCFYGTACGVITITLRPDGISIIAGENAEKLMLLPRWDNQNQSLPSIDASSKNSVALRYNAYPYSVTLRRGRFGDDFAVCADGGMIDLSVK